MRGHEYSIYSGLSPSSRSGVYALLAITAAAMVSGLHGIGIWLAGELLHGEKDHSRLILFLGSIAPLGLFGLLVYAFNHWGWRQNWMRPIFALARATQPAPLYGRYTGKVRRLALENG